MRARTGRWSWLRPWLEGLGLVVALQFVLFGLLVAGQAVPDRPIVENLAAAAERGTYGPNTMVDRMGGRADSFTECVVVDTGLGAPPGESAFSRAVRMPRGYNCKGGPELFRTMQAGGAVVPDDNYYKYWAGYTVITRPVLALLGIEGLRIVAGSLMVVLGVAAFLVVRARTTLPVAVALLLPLVLGTNLLSTPSTSFSQSLSTAFALLSVVLAASGAARSVRLGLLGTALGAALFCFVDLLTTPAIPWAMSAFVLGAVTWFRSRELRGAATAVLLGGFVWPAVFGITWVSRWVIGAAFLGVRPTVDMVRENIGFRTTGQWAGVSDELGAAVVANADYWWSVVPTSAPVLVGCVIATALGLALGVRRGGLGRLAVAGVLAAPALVVPVWYLALSNHSQIHAFFVHRNVPAALAVMTAAALAAAARPARTSAPAPEATAEPAGASPAGTPSHDAVLAPR